jgi:hypothetical protein
MANMPQNYTKSDYERAEHEWYVDPPWVTEALIDQIPFLGTIWDPACGRGTIPEVFRSRGYETMATDLIDRGYERFDQQLDFLSLQAGLVSEPGPINIVTNPPFNLSVEFVQQAMLIDQIDRVAIIAQLKFLASQARFNLFRQYPPTDVLILSRRPSMPPGALIEEMGDRAFKGGQMDYCWIVWRLGHRGATRIQWLNPS